MGTDAVSEAAWRLTATWQFDCLPSAPHHWRATPTDICPSLGNETSSITHTTGSTTGTVFSATARSTAAWSHGDWFTNCCRACMSPSGSRSAIGWIDLRRPSSINPRR